MMGTKEKPGEFDCYAAAKSDEPMFVLLARDPSAPILVALWALIREKRGGGDSLRKVQEVRQCAHSMDAWRLKQVEESGLTSVKTEEALKVEAVQEAFRNAIADLMMGEHDDVLTELPR